MAYFFILTLLKVQRSHRSNTKLLSHRHRAKKLSQCGVVIRLDEQMENVIRRTVHCKMDFHAQLLTMLRDCRHEFLHSSSDFLVIHRTLISTVSGGDVE
ncbi:hypothetical protein AYW79_04270 [Ferroacidibacillus organovorans]|uniref:Uncharacterized protein n=1 Tax=Ferroacidibacillus organovorans TaxID=1765683 RepID=A0A853KE10_9BACL|nr:hypothetical protein AYJ22_03345 [Ferroacidibacillus organovorans]OAG94578.1 hypothetical protein AYW79_04270 [Ferroacidibacillus organovorans]